MLVQISTKQKQTKWLLNWFVLLIHSLSEYQYKIRQQLLKHRLNYQEQKLFSFFILKIEPTKIANMNSIINIGNLKIPFLLLSMPKIIINGN
jgi:hypothetical protein